jgi:hypothetical protein
MFVGAVELADVVGTFLGSAAGARAQIKWYDYTGREAGTAGIPSMIQDKLMTSLKSMPPGGAG